MHSCPYAHCLTAGQAAKLPLSLSGSASVLGFAFTRQARQCIRPYRVHHFINYGLVVRFWLLPTPPLGDAVFLQLRTASALSDGDFHPTVGAHFQAHLVAHSSRLGNRPGSESRAVAPFNLNSLRPCAERRCNRERARIPHPDIAKQGRKNSNLTGQSHRHLIDQNFDAAIPKREGQVIPASGETTGRALLYIYTTQ